MITWLYHGLSWTWGGYRFRSSAAGYNIFSGDVGDITLVGGAWLILKKHNCHAHRCWRLSWHPDEDGHPVCKVHHPDHPAKPLWRRILRP